MKIVLATNNPHKVEEITRIIKGIFPDSEIKTLKEIGFNEEIEETEETLMGNALLKAKTISEKYNVFTISDDTGLEVDALGGRPGVYTARYAGEHCTAEDNIKKMLAEMKDVPLDKRSAKFRCVICGYFPDGKTIFGNGCVDGYITTETDGTKSFGYDPIFFSTELNKTFGVASAEEKDSVSHRARALKDFVSQMESKK